LSAQREREHNEGEEEAGGEFHIKLRGCGEGGGVESFRASCFGRTRICRCGPG
jgi:hypothetical protein